MQFIMKYCEYCEGYVLIDSPLYFYVQREESALHSLRFDIMEHQLFTFYIRTPFLSAEDMPAYCDGHLYAFIHYFDVVWHCENKMTVREKFRYNQRMIKSKEFKYCLEHATGKNESPLMMKILRTYNYYVFWLFRKLEEIKKKVS